jgi:hypothetical protein
MAATGCLLMDRDGLSSLYRGPSIDASYQVSDHLAKWFQRRRFLEIDQSEIRIACSILVSDWLIFNILLLCKRLAK